MMSVPHTPWQTGICDCCGDHDRSSEQCQFFCQSLFCQPCAQGTLQQNAGLASDCCGPCCFYSLCSGTALGMLIPYISLFNLRRSVSEKDNIGEGCLKTCCCVLCWCSYGAYCRGAVCSAGARVVFTVVVLCVLLVLVWCLLS